MGGGGRCAAFPPPPSAPPPTPAPICPNSHLSSPGPVGPAEPSSPGSAPCVSEGSKGHCVGREFLDHPPLLPGWPWWFSSVLIRGPLEAATEKLQRWWEPRSPSQVPPRSPQGNEPRMRGVAGSPQAVMIFFFFFFYHPPPVLTDSSAWSSPNLSQSGVSWTPAPYTEGPAQATEALLRGCPGSWVWDLLPGSLLSSAPAL